MRDNDLLVMRSIIDAMMECKNNSAYYTYYVLRDLMLFPSFFGSNAAMRLIQGRSLERRFLRHILLAMLFRKKDCRNSQNRLETEPGRKSSNHQWAVQLVLVSRQIQKRVSENRNQNNKKALESMLLAHLLAAVFHHKYMSFPSKEVVARQ